MNKFSAHNVYCNKDDKEVPSVTTILKIINKPSLMYWANGMGFRRKKIDDILHETAEIGTALHDMIANHSLGKKNCVLDNPDSLELFDKYLKWIEDKDMKPLLVETSLSCKYFGGTIDSVCRLNGKMTLMDYKTSKGIYPTMFLQLAGYIILIKENMKDLFDEIEQVGILSISKKKGIQTLFITKKELLEEYVPVFLTAMKFFHMWYSLNIEKWDTDILK